MFKKLKVKTDTNMIIGFFGKSVIITYIGVISGVIGINFGLMGKTNLALVCLMISAFCDGIDGKVARACKRSEEEKSFGIQLDSLADMVSFVFLPVAIFYGLGLTSWQHIMIYSLYTMGGVTRLAYFNVIAETVKEGPVPVYSGLPVPVSAVIFPLTYLLHYVLDARTFYALYAYTMLFVAILFVLNFKIKKPKNTYIYAFLVFVIFMSGILFYLGRR